MFSLNFELSIGIKASALAMVSLPKCNPKPHFEMDRSQSLNAPPYFDGSNYAFWKVHIRAFLCSIDYSVWDAVEIGWTRLEAAKSTWDKAALAVANANSKALNAICKVVIYNYVLCWLYSMTKSVVIALILFLVFCEILLY